MERLEGEGFLVLFKGGGCRASLRFRLFVSDVNQGLNSRFSCMATGVERLSLDLSQAVKNIVRCGNVWNYNRRLV